MPSSLPENRERRKWQRISVLTTHEKSPGDFRTYWREREREAPSQKMSWRQKNIGLQLQTPQVSVALLWQITLYFVRELDKITSAKREIYCPEELK